MVHAKQGTLGQAAGLFLAPTHMIEPEVPFANIIAFVEAVKAASEASGGPPAQVSPRLRRLRRRGQDRNERGDGRSRSHPAQGSADRAGRVRTGRSACGRPARRNDGGGHGRTSPAGTRAPEGGERPGTGGPDRPPHQPEWLTGVQPCDRRLISGTAPPSENSYARSTRGVPGHTALSLLWSLQDQPVIGPADCRLTLPVCPCRAPASVRRDPRPSSGRAKVRCLSC